MRDRQNLRSQIRVHSSKVIFFALFSASLFLTAQISYGQLMELERQSIATADGGTEVRDGDCPDGHVDLQRDHVKVVVKQSNQRYEVNIEQQQDGDRQKWRFSGNLEQILEHLEVSVPEEIRERVLKKLPS